MDYQSLIIVLALAISSTAQFNRHQISSGTEKSRKLPNIDICGKGVTTLGERVINGEPAVLGEFPWMANIGYRQRNSPRIAWACGGSLITDQYVITAAHCLHPQLIKGFQVHAVRLGELDLDDQVQDGASPVDFGIETNVYHKEFNNYRKVHDIGLVKLDRKVTFTKTIKPICLPPPEFSTEMFVGYSPIIAGWGKSVNKTDGIQGTKLLKAYIVIQDLEECRRNLTTKRKAIVIDENVVCAYSDETDSCEGDSGGPLMFHRKVKNTPESSLSNMFLMGIVSYGYRCAVPGFPGVYTRVAKYMPWIIDNMEI